MFKATALQIIRQTTAELGLPVPNSAVTSQEATVVQLLALLNSAGYELSYGYEWQSLIRKATITVVAGQSDYALPSDFSKMINQTIWSSDTLQPVQGPLSPQRWEMRTEGIVGFGPFVGFRIIGGKLALYPAPTVGAEITFEYMSNGWVQSYLDPNQFVPYITNDLDTPQFDFMLLVKFLKVKLWNAKGLDTTALETEFRRVFDMMTSGDKGAPMLTISPRRHAAGLPLNAPETGYGR
jgi:hypothetical protein